MVKSKLMAFDLELLPVKGEGLKLIKFSKFFSKNYPLLMIMAGCHGEEPAPPLAIFENLQLIFRTAEKSKVSLVIYPLVNPWGFVRGERLTRLGLNCNRNWVHEKISGIANEIKAVAKDIKKYKPKIFANLHEDNEVKKEFYAFTYGNKKYDKYLVKVGGKYFPVLKDGDYKQDLKHHTFLDFKIKGGVAHDHHDGSAEDWMIHRGCDFTCCAETPSAQPLERRILCNRDLILKLIELTPHITSAAR